MFNPTHKYIYPENFDDRIFYRTDEYYNQSCIVIEQMASKLTISSKFVTIHDPEFRVEFEDGKQIVVSANEIEPLGGVLVD